MTGGDCSVCGLTASLCDDCHTASICGRCGAAKKQDYLCDACAESDAREIADLNPAIAARNARLHAWANGWRKSQVAPEPVPLTQVKRQGTVRVVEGVAADGTRIVADPLAPSRGRKPTWYVRRGDALVRVA